MLSHPLTLNFVELYNNSQFSDIRLLHGENTIHAHRLVLARACKYFEDVLKGCGSTLTVTDTMLRYIKYVYTGQLELTNDMITEYSMMMLLGLDALFETYVAHLSKDFGNNLIEIMLIDDPTATKLLRALLDKTLLLERNMLDNMIWTFLKNDSAPRIPRANFLVFLDRVKAKPMPQHLARLYNYWLFSHSGEKLLDVAPKVTINKSYVVDARVYFKRVPPDTRINNTGSPFLIEAPGKGISGVLASDITPQDFE